MRKERPVLLGKEGGLLRKEKSVLLGKKESCCAERPPPFTRFTVGQADERPPYVTGSHIVDRYEAQTGALGGGRCTSCSLLITRFTVGEHSSHPNIHRFTLSGENVQKWRPCTSRVVSSGPEEGGREQE